MAFMYSKVYISGVPCKYKVRYCKHPRRGLALRKLMVVASMLAMVMLAASPALAQNAGGAQYSEQNAQGSNINQSSQQCQNGTGDINVAGGDNNAAISDDDTNAAVGGNAGASQYQYGDNAGGDGNLSDDDTNAIGQENNTEVNVAQQCVQDGSGVNAAQFNFFGLSNLFG